MEDPKSQAPSSLRSVANFFAQWILPVLAVLVLFLILRGSLIQVRTLKGMFTFSPGFEDSSPTCEALLGREGLTFDQKLILHGDQARKTTLEQQKAIWEKWPTNLVYLHNYISQRLAQAPYRGAEVKENREWRQLFAREIEGFQTLDPRNARMDYILAGNLLAEAIKDDLHSITNADGTVKSEWGMKVLDRAKLDKAMDLFRAGLAKPGVRRYANTMAAERLAIMGEPTSLFKQIAQIGMLAGVLTPDLSTWRQLGRSSMAYSRLLIEEGRTEEAKVFLANCRKFVPQINNEAYTLIDILVVGAIAGIMAEQMPAAYTKLGDVAAANQAGIETAALAQPIKDWKTKQKEFSKDDATEKRVLRHSGLLMGMLLPALGEYPTVAELAPSRLLEYVVAERAALGAFSIGLVILMVFCIGLGLYYHRISKTSPRSVFLQAGYPAWGRLLLWGVLLPVLCYYAATRGFPWGNRSLGPALNYPQLLIQFMALSLVIVSVSFTLVRRQVLRGCAEWGLPQTPLAPVFWRAWWWALPGVTVLLGIMPEAWLNTDDHEWTVILPVIVDGALGLACLVYLVYGIIRREWFRATYAAYSGSLMRGLVSAIALVIIVLNGILQPWLARQERRLIAADTVMHIDAGGGFTRIETRVVQRLKAEMQQAAARFPELHARAGDNQEI